MAAPNADAVDFTRDVRPILADKCFHCHGPDPESRQADMRLDMWKSAGDVHGAEEIIVAGKPDESELVARITADDPDEQMPPADSGKTLTPEQIETLKKWVAQGAEYQAALGVRAAAAARRSRGERLRLGSAIRSMPSCSRGWNGRD